MALFATFYQLYLQRIHNEKSLRPLAQIVLGDHDAQIFVRIKNNGLGPMIVEALTFTRDGKGYGKIEDCLDLDPKSYMHIIEIESAKKIILPGAFLEIFNKRFDQEQVDSEKYLIRQALYPISLKVIGRDIYDKKFTIERDFKWFARHG